MWIFPHKIPWRWCWGMTRISNILFRGYLKPISTYLPLRIDFDCCLWPLLWYRDRRKFHPHSWVHRTQKQSILFSLFFDWLILSCNHSTFHRDTISNARIGHYFWGRWSNSSIIFTFNIRRCIRIYYEPEFA